MDYAIPENKCCSRAMRLKLLARNSYLLPERPGHSNTDLRKTLAALPAITGGVHGRARLYKSCKSRVHRYRAGAWALTMSAS